MRKSVILLCLSWISSCMYLHAQSVKPFEKGDRVAFVGNSITHEGYYETYIWLYYMTHFPERRLTVRNAGIGGDEAKNIDVRLKQDALSLNPNVLVLTFGMNDSGYFQYNWDNPQEFADGKVEESYGHFQSIISQLKSEPKVRPIIMSSSPYDETMKNENNLFAGKSKTMERMVAFQKEEAEINKWEYVDLYYPMQEINLKGQKSNPEFTITGPDRIHPGNGGHLVMAYLFLKSQGLESPVAEVILDAQGKKVEKSENASISNFIVSDNLLSFDYLAKSLPYPVDTVSKIWGNDQKESLALEVVPFIEDFNREIIQVNKLMPAGNYELTIDGDSIGVWSGEAFGKGVNLGEIRSTPQYKQAWTVMNLANNIRGIDNKLRDYSWMQFDLFKDMGMLYQDDQKAVEAARAASVENVFARSKMEIYEGMRFEEIRKTYEDQIQTISDVIYRVNKPIARKVEIKLVD